MNRRIQLQELLEQTKGLAIIPSTKRPAVYFQPPPTIRLVYPCIVYSLDTINKTYANDKTYLNKKRYTITIMDKDPDSEIPNTFLEMSLCRFDRAYPADDLNHWVFNLFY